MTDVVTLEVGAVLLDLDGVLVDSTAGVERRWAAFAGANGVDPAALLATIHGRRGVDILREHTPWLPAEETAARLLQEEVDEAGADVPLAGAAALLAALPPGRAAIVTSCNLPLARARLGATGLTAPQVLVTADDVGAGKPDPGGYLAAAARLGIDPAECVVIEDAPAGIAAARAAGMRCIAVATTNPPARLAGATLVTTSVAAVTVATTPSGLALTAPRVPPD